MGDVSAPLDAAGLPNAPTNGSFQILVRDRKSGLTKTTTINVDLNGLDQDSSLTNVVTQLNAVSGISASLTSDGKLKIQSASVDQDFSFANGSTNVTARILA